MMCVAACGVLAGCAQQPAAPLYGATNNPAAHVYQVRFFSHHYPRLQGEAIQNITIAGDFNDWIPGSWALARQGDGGWSVRLALTNGVYTYHFVVGREKQAPLFLHDIRCSYLFDDGWNGVKVRVRTNRHCLYIRRSGFRARDGRMLPLQGGIKVPFTAPVKRRRVAGP